MKGCSTRAMTVVATVLSCFVPVPRKMASGLGINEIAAPSLVSAQCPTLGRLPYSDVLELDNLASEFVVLCVRFDLQRKVTGFTALLKEVAEAAGGDPIIERT